MPRHSKKHESVMEVLASSTGPMSATELLDELRKGQRGAGIGIATIYRSLKRGVEHGELIAVELESGAVRYEPSDLEHHHHFLCTGCSRAFDLEGCVKNLEQLLPTGFEMTRHEVLLHGRCAECRIAG
ncbi:MAG: transcriptional repressor [Planctomycetes bacterium]|nr:transcriptional repressor [Planctomycetota bacterium]